MSRKRALSSRRSPPSNRKLKIFKSAALKATSSPGESEAEFRVRLSQSAREQRDAQLEKLRQKYAPKIAALEERIRKAQVRVEKEKSQANQQTMNTVLSFGTSILGALFGRKLLSSTNVTRAATSARQAGKILRERQDISDAAEGVEAIEEQLKLLNEQFEAETEKLQASLAPDALELTEVLVQPKKADISVQEVALAWQPWVVRMDGAVEPGS
jgi:flagellar motility protein MotE (MotC chaperone)